MKIIVMEIVAGGHGDLMFSIDDATAAQVTAYASVAEIVVGGCLYDVVGSCKMNHDTQEITVEVMLQGQGSMVERWLEHEK